MNGRLILNDIKQGIFRRAFFFVPAIMLSLYAAVTAHHMAQLSDEEVSFLSVTMEIFRGAKIVRDPGELYFVSPFFLMVHSWLAIIVAYYPYYDMKDRGVQIFTRCGQKSSWWISKCIWNFLTVFLFYFILLVVGFLFSAAAGSPGLTVSETVWYGSLMAQAAVPGAGTLILYVIVMPFITSVALSMLQMLLSIVFVPVIGALANILILLCSLCFCSQWLPGNALMVMRMDICNPEGISFLPTIIIDVVVIAVSFAAGLFLLKKKDII